MESEFISHADQGASKAMMCSKPTEALTSKLIQIANTGFPVEGS